MDAAPLEPARKRKGRASAAGSDAGPPSPGGVVGAGASGENRLLAGYLAHEFLTRGTVRGERPGASQDAGSATGQGQGQGHGRAAQYEAVAVLVQGGGARVPGVVNPAQLAAWVSR